MATSPANSPKFLVGVREKQLTMTDREALAATHAEIAALEAQIKQPVMILQRTFVD